MKYIPPINGDTTNENRSWITGDPASGIEGSIPPAEAFEHPIREIVNLIAAMGLTPDGGDLTQLQQAIAAMIAAAMPPAGRIRLTNNLTVYVSPDGDDLADGLTAATAKQTIQSAYNLVADQYDLAGHRAYIQLGTGTYAAGLLVTRPVAGGGLSDIIVVGDAENPATVVVSPPAGTAFGAQGPGCSITISGLSVGGAWGLVASNGGVLSVGQAVRFAACSSAHMAASYDGAIMLGSSYTVVGGAQFHMSAQGGRIYVSAITATMVGTPAFSQTARALEVGRLALGNMTFSGGATGLRYAASSNGIIYTAGAGASFIPGNSAGVVSTGGQYV